MKNAPLTIAAGMAVLAISGIVGAQFVKTHTISVRLPDGGEARVFYAGNVPPGITVEPDGRTIAASWLPERFVAESPFAEMDWVAAEMDREADVMLRDTATPIPTGPLAPGAQGYSFASTLSGAGVCSRSVEIIADGHGDRPRVLTRTTGDCRVSPRPAKRALEPAPEPTTRLEVVAASYQVPTRS